MGFTPGHRQVAVDFDIDFMRFDYGILARRIQPETEMDGLFSLDVELATKAPSVEQLMEHASGFIDFAIFPEEFESGIFDLWAVNLMTAVLPEVDKSKNSKINCVVGLFDIEDGRLSERSLLMDTSKMSVGGKVDVDFHTDEVKVMLKPRPRSPSSSPSPRRSR